MKISDSLKGIVSKSIISNVLEGVQYIDLEALSSSTTASSKIGSTLFPTIDPGLIDGQSGNIFSKNNQNTEVFLPLKQARQIARSVAVVKGNLPAAFEQDSEISWDDPRVSSRVMLEDVIQMGSFEYFIDVELNDGSTIYLTSYSRDCFVPSLFYGHKDFSFTQGRTYDAEATIISLGDEAETTEQRIDDGSTTGTLVIPDTVAGAVEAAQTGKFIDAKIRVRLAVVRDAKILFGPVRLTTLKADKITHSLNVKDKASVLSIVLVKNWDTILNRYGMVAAYADHISRFPGDNFMRYTSNTQASFTWKQR